MKLSVKKYIAVFLAVFALFFSLLSSYELAYASSSFWDYMIGGVDFLEKLLGLPADLVTGAINSGLDLGEKYNRIMSEGESNGIDYGAYYNKSENMFYLKKNEYNQVVINKNLYNVVHSVAKEIASKHDGYYLFTPSHDWNEFFATQNDKKKFISDYYGNADALSYFKSTRFDEEYADLVKSKKFLFALKRTRRYKDTVYDTRARFCYSNVSGFDSVYYMAVNSDGKGISCYKKSENASKSYYITLPYVTCGNAGLPSRVLYFDTASSQNISSFLFDALNFGSDDLYGSPFRVFYSKQDLLNFWNNGSSNTTFVPDFNFNGALNIPSDLLTSGDFAKKISDLFNGLDISGKAELEIQNDFNTTVNNYIDNFTHDPSISPTPTPSGGGSGGGFGDGTTPTPAPDFSDGLEDTNDYLKQILEKVTNILQIDTEFSKSFETVSQNLCKYLESNNEKLDQIITAINALSNGKTEDVVNGCKYDFTQLSESLTKIWNKSDQKFDKMIELLEENNKYQEKIVGDLNDIKAILIAQTVLEAFQNRSQETANKAKEKFPTSIPWDIAMIVNTFSAEPEPIKVELPIKVDSLNINESITVDLSSGEWEKLGKLCRYMLSVLFILFLIQLSRKLFSNGGDE